MKVLNIFVVITLFLASCTQEPKTFFEKLQQMPGVVSVDSIELDTNFVQQYELYFEQPLDHKNPEIGTFNQRVVLSHQCFEKPMVAVLEGYRIWSGRQDELTQLLKSNQVNIEHRFFKDSKPDSIPWDKLTIWQAATDQHNIIQALRRLYKGKWLTTGISKGGQTTMYHRSFYPSDVDASVPYVAPLNFAREDQRIYDFLNSVGSDADRKRIYEFQIQCFENFNDLQNLLVEKAKEKKWTFKFGFKKALEYTILEYPFVFWQWGGYSTDQIPTVKATTKELFEHLNNVAGFTFFEDKGVEEILPFFWAALTEIGIYGYQTAPFKKYLGDTTDYTFDFTAPKGTNPQYNAEAMKSVKNFLDNDASNMLFIVGGLDTWGSTGYKPSGKNNLVNMTLSGGHHGTRIRNFNKEDRKYIYSLLEEWLNVKIEDLFEDK